MPELPEVETTCLGIRPVLQNKTIEKIIVRNPRLRQKVPENLHQICQNQRILDVRRRAKYLLIELERGTILIHLGMSGHLTILSTAVPTKKHDHIDLVLGSGTVLRYTDPRRFGLWDYSPGNVLQHPLMQTLGLEPLSKDFHAEHLYQRSRRRKISSKTLIMDKKIVVGIGNIYACESLFQAKIHPARPAEQLSLKECHRLSLAIKNVLTQAIEAGGTSLKDFITPQGKLGYFTQALRVYGQTNAPCLECNASIQTLTLSGRNTWFCSQCQK